MKLAGREWTETEVQQLTLDEIAEIHRKYVEHRTLLEENFEKAIADPELQAAARLFDAWCSEFMSRLIQEREFLKVQHQARIDTLHPDGVDGYFKAEEAQMHTWADGDGKGLFTVTYHGWRPMQAVVFRDHHHQPEEFLDFRVNGPSGNYASRVVLRNEEITRFAEWFLKSLRNAQFRPKGDA